MNSILQGGARLGGSEQTGVMQSSGPTTNKHCFFLKIVATSAILDELKTFSARVERMTTLFLPLSICRR